jgi:RNA polymerase sigma-70 factor (ECF subfamily)
MEVKFPRSSRSEEDRALIDAAKRGENRAFEKLLKKYYKSVYYLIFKMVRNAEDAEDLTQESFAKAFNSITTFDPKFAFSTWLFKIATNNCIDYIRRKKMQTLSLSQSPSGDDNSGVTLQIADSDPVPDEVMLKKQRREIVARAVEALPERYQQLIQLRYFRELSYEEVAQELKIPLGTVKAQLHRAKELLNEALEDIKRTF